MRPLSHYSKEELLYFFNNNKIVKQAWKDVRPFMAEKDTRGIRRWVFALGWLACLFYYSAFFERMGQSIADSATERGEKMLIEFDRRSKAGLVGASLLSKHKGKSTEEGIDEEVS